MTVQKPETSWRTERLSFAPSKGSRIRVTGVDCLESGVVSSITGILVAAKVHMVWLRTSLVKCKSQNPRFVGNFNAHLGRLHRRA